MALPGDLQKVLLAQFSAPQAESWPPAAFRVWLHAQVPELDNVQKLFATAFLPTPRDLLLKIAAWAGSATFSALNYLPSAEIAFLNAVHQNQPTIFLDLMLRHHEVTDAVMLALLRQHHLPGLRADIEKMLSYALARYIYPSPSAIFDEIILGNIFLTSSLVTLLLATPHNYRSALFNGAALALGLNFVVPHATDQQAYRDFAIGYLAAGGKDLATLTSFAGLRPFINADNNEVIAILNLAHYVDNDQILLQHLAYRTLGQLPRTGQRVFPIVTIALHEPAILQERAAQLLPLLPEIYAVDAAYQVYMAQLRFIINPFDSSAPDIPDSLLIIFGRANLLSKFFADAHHIDIKNVLRLVTDPVALIRASRVYSSERLATLPYWFYTGLAERAANLGQLYAFAKEYMPILRAQIPLLINVSMSHTIETLHVMLTHHPAKILTSSLVCEALVDPVFLEVYEDVFYEKDSDDFDSSATIEYEIRFRYREQLVYAVLNDYTAEIWREHGLAIPQIFTNTWPDLREAAAKIRASVLQPWKSIEAMPRDEL